MHKVLKNIFFFTNIYTVTFCRQLTQNRHTLYSGRNLFSIKNTNFPFSPETRLSIKKIQPFMELASI